MGFADSPATRNALANHGIRVSGFRWRWALGLGGGTFPPHRKLNGRFGNDSNSFEGRIPRQDVNGSSCMCSLVPNYRTADGKIAKPGLEPVFQTPFVASLGQPATPVVIEPKPIDFGPLVAALSDQPPIYVNVTIPDGAIVVNVPETVVNVHPTPVNISSPDVNVNVPPAQISIDSPVTVEPTVVNVDPTPVKVENKIIPESKMRRVFRKIVRDSNGTIIGVEDEEQ